MPAPQKLTVGGAALRLSGKCLESALSDRRRLWLRERGVGMHRRAVQGRAAACRQASGAASP